MLPCPACKKIGASLPLVARRLQLLYLYNMTPRDMPQDRNTLLDFLTRHYTLDGLKTLCFNLFVDYDNLSGDTKNAKGRELILHLERAGRLNDLEAVLGRQQPRAYEREFLRPPPVPPIPARPNRDPRQVFISHAHEDDGFAHRLAADLRRRGWGVWIAPDSIAPGETWVDAINRGLEASSYYVLVLTPAASASPWVNTETNVAISLEHQRIMRFIPLDVAPAGRRRCGRPIRMCPSAIIRPGWSTCWRGWRGDRRGRNRPTAWRRVGLRRRVCSPTGGCTTVRVSSWRAWPRGRSSMARVRPIRAMSWRNGRCGWASTGSAGRR